ncbi:NAD(P)H-dependent oxidoreductase [Pedobacter cryophilus]|uniref:NAD(P)H-dependent oxidoreductase n=1 Tax=Pedobacter cryophilus TaxID=2571271 RepID=A0A4U1C3F0_9SPHI|nr:NAD(P)H-dependent oxidoreductase [Pedobacter cryophilus]TKC00376.1 NAD(P)H-dependent oxidoreductase [Pedobacter cryophilus]
MENTQTENIISSLDWRYATKSFDATKKLNNQQLDLLLSAVQLSPSSYGLQPYQIIVVSNQEIKEQLKAAAYGQAQLADASHVFVFARTKNFGTQHVDEYADNIAKTRGTSIDAIKGFVDVMKGTVDSRSQEELANWNARQAYISLGILLQTASLTAIDACPMEGFDSSKFDEILGLDEKNLTAVVIAPVGFRSEDDAYQHFQKVRKSKEDLFIHI